MAEHDANVIADRDAAEFRRRGGSGGSP